MTRPLGACPDCCATVAGAGNTITHAETCPLGRATESVSDRDRQWFEQHPTATEYERPAHWSEIAELRWINGLGGAGSVRVQVVQIAPGVRMRGFITSGPAAPAAEGLNRAARRALRKRRRTGGAT